MPPIRQPNIADEVAALRREVEQLRRQIKDSPAAIAYRRVQLEDLDLQPREVLRVIGASSIDDNPENGSTDLTLAGGVMSEVLPWTPDWATDATQPDFGSASISADAVAVGELVLANFYVDFDADTTFGSGPWSMALPVSQASSWQSSFGLLRMEQPGEGHEVGFVRTGASWVELYLFNGAAITATTPWTWDETGALEFSVVYRRA